MGEWGNRRWWWGVDGGRGKGPEDDLLSYSGIVTRVFTWFLIIYFTILIITGSNIIKLDRRNNEGRENK